VNVASVAHLTVEERVERGRAARSHAPRSTHAALEIAAARDPVAWLEAQAATLVAELVSIRYGRMLSSPFAFFRGAAVVMANDLAAAPRSGLDVQLCGDAHLLNFGGFASPERDLVFDLNDFDETLPGPFEWGVKRLATSLEIADGGRGAARASVQAYRETMRDLAAKGNLDAWYAHVDARSLVAELRGRRKAGDAKTVEREADRARSNDSAHELAKLTHVVDGEPRIASEPPLIVPISELADADGLETTLRAVYRSYRRSLPTDRRRLLTSFRYGDLAHKVVGIGSVGTRCWIILLLGRDDRDPLFLQLKEAQPSALEPFLGRSELASHAQRIVEGQLLSQAVSDIFLGWTRAADLDGVERDYYVRQLRDWKLSIDVGDMRSRALTTYGRLCGATLARAHARSGDRVAIAAYLGKADAFDRAVGAFASAYAAVNERDHASLRRAVDEGRVVAAEGI